MMHHNKIGLLLSFLFVIAFFTGSYSQSAPPSDLTAEADGNTVRLSWTAPSTDQKVTFNIYRAETTSTSEAVDPAQLDFTKISAVTEPAYEDKLDEASGQTFVYYVVAVNIDGVESAGSNYANATVGVTGAESNDTY